MNKTLLIFKHEFLHTITRTGFIVLTLALPVLALLGIGIFHIISGIARPAAEVTKIGYVDQTGSFDQFTSQGNITLVPMDSPETATQALIRNDIKEYFVIPSDYSTSGLISVYTLEKQVIPPQEVETAIKSFLVNNLLTEKVPEATKIGRAHV
jgi:ABC-2 type transport system permease protein